MKFVFISLCFFLSTCSANAEGRPTQFHLPRETLQSPPAQWQKQMALQYANFSVKHWVNSDPSCSFRRNPAELKKLEGIRKTIAAIGVSMLIPSAIFFGLLGGGAFSKTLSSEERKKSIKWMAIGVLLMALASYWNEFVTMAMLTFMG
ncbi:MAG: hypothetical protein Q8K12_14925 [Thiobacillus sp.]|nr:hypothetical protein [Thiobacillus sp.]